MVSACGHKPAQDEAGQAALRRQCLITAGGIAGGEVELLDFGHFAANSPLDCVVAGLLPGAEQSGDGVLAARVLILRRQGQDWRIALDAAKWVTNPEGYLGMETLDDSYDFKGLRAVVDQKAPNGQPGITLWLKYLDENGEDEGDAKAFSLNPATGRYQEFDDRQGFKPEIRNPAHLHGK